MTASALAAYRVGALLLAAGKGTRMRSVLPKPLVPLAGRPIVQHLLDALRAVGMAPLGLVVGHGADEVQAALGPEHVYVRQAEQRGTGHAVAMACQVLEPMPLDALFVSVGDSPLLRPATLRRMMEHHLGSAADCTFLTGVFADPLPYARVIRDRHGQVTACLEERDCKPEQAVIRELFTSHYLFRPSILWRHVAEIAANPGSGEVYLTDLIGIMLRHGLRLEALQVADPRELVGLNTPEELAWAEGVLAERHTPGL